jgi:hypothetical protein
MRSRHAPVLAAAAIAAAFSTGTTAAAQTPAPTLAVDHPCYSDGDTLRYSGAGYTPNGAVGVTLSGNGRLGDLSGVALADGTLAGDVSVDNTDDFLDADQLAGDFVLSATDQAVAAASPTPPAPVVAPVRISRFAIFWRARLRPGHPVTFRAVGFTTALRRNLYLHYVRGRREVGTVRLGRLAGPCGDVTRRLADPFPFRHVRAGRYRLIFNTSRHDLRAAPWLAGTTRVTRRDARP